jgi:rubrerythrin
MDQTTRQLVDILQSAYSGELAAAYAYRGHWKSLKDLTEKEGVYQIEDEEWAHRRGVKRMLDELGFSPQRTREVVMWLVGRAVGVACHVTGRFMPMYFAGLLERGNVREYEEAARCAEQLGLWGFKAELLSMAEAERRHELFFMTTIKDHRLAPLMQAIFCRD